MDKRGGQGYTLPDLRTNRQIAHRFRMAGGAIVTDNGLLASEAFDPEVQDDGWGIFGDGTAVFADVELRGDVVADTLATGVSPDERIEVTTDDSSTFFFYTGDDEETGPGQLGVDVVDAPAANRYPAAQFVLPAFDTRPAPAIYLFGESLDGTGGSATAQLFADGTNFLVMGAIGTAAHPSGTGMRLLTEGDIDIDTDGTCDIDAGGTFALTAPSIQFIGPTIITDTITVQGDLILLSNPSNIPYYVRVDDAGVLSTTAV
jgi:hypothetical protein